jgi:hypothetical protein
MKKEREMPLTNLILLSGGPGLFDPKDQQQHDHSWANYVTPPLLLAKQAAFVKPDEKVVWYVYRPAYAARWENDVKNPHKMEIIKKATEDVKAKGFTSYANLIERRASEKGWSLYWLETASQFWAKIKTLRHPISRTAYWGHARNDLWLSLTHSSAGEAQSPDSSAILPYSDVMIHRTDPQLVFLQRDASRVHRFIGCNTTLFAQAWAKAFKVYSEGVNGKVDFSSIYSAESSGEPKVVHPGSRVIYAPLD